MKDYHSIWLKDNKNLAKKQKWYRFSPCGHPVCSNEQCRFDLGSAEFIYLAHNFKLNEGCPICNLQNK